MKYEVYSKTVLGDEGSVTFTDYVPANKYFNQLLNDNDIVHLVLYNEKNKELRKKK